MNEEMCSVMGSSYKWNGGACVCVSVSVCARESLNLYTKFKLTVQKH